MNQIIYVSTFYVSPGGSSERIILYYAEVDDTGHVAHGGGLEDEDEDIKIVEFSLSEIFNAVGSGRIADAKTIIAIMWLKARCERKRNMSTWRPLTESQPAQQAAQDVLSLSISQQEALTRRDEAQKLRDHFS